MASLRSAPRPAKPLPNSIEVRRDAVRVGSSNMLRTSSISTGSGVACVSGIVAAVGAALRSTCPA